MGDKFLREFFRENLRKKPLCIGGGRRQDNIEMDLKGTECGYVDWIICLKVGTSERKL